HPPLPPSVMTHAPPPSPWEWAICLSFPPRPWESAIGNGESGRKTSPHRTPPRFFHRHLPRFIIPPSHDSPFPIADSRSLPAVRSPSAVPSPRFLDLLRGPLQNLPDLAHPFRVLCVAWANGVRGAGDILERLAQLQHGFAEERAAEVRDALEDVVHRRTILGQVGFPAIGYLVDLLAPFLLSSRGVAHVLEHGERRVHRARAGRVGAAKLLLELLDNFVAVARLFVEQLEDDILEIALFEHATGAEWSAAPSAWPSPEPCGEAGVEGASRAEPGRAESVAIV